MSIVRYCVCCLQVQGRLLRVSGWLRIRARDGESCFSFYIPLFGSHCASGLLFPTSYTRFVIFTVCLFPEEKTKTRKGEREKSVANYLRIWSLIIFLRFLLSLVDFYLLRKHKKIKEAKNWMEEIQLELIFFFLFLFKFELKLIVRHIEVQLLVLLEYA